MIVSRLLSLLAQPGIAATLDRLAQDNTTAFPRATLENLFAEQGATAPSGAVENCMEAHLVVPYGPRLGISNIGRRTALLIEALEGGDVERLIRRIHRLTGTRAQYELVREGMTKMFFKSLVDRSDPGRLFFCSPWINPSEREAAILKHTVLQNDKRGNKVDVVVLTRPPDMMPPGAQDGLQCFKEIGAQIFVNSRLHSKLYIREPNANGGTSMAIVGSQNLTRSGYIELGIRINGDSGMIDELIRYFLGLTSHSTELTE